MSIKYLLGATHYLFVQLPGDRSLSIFGDYHTRYGICPEKNTIYLADYLYQVFINNKDKTFKLYLEIYSNTPHSPLQQRGDMDKMYNFFQQHPLSNVKVLNADIRIKGIHTQMSRVLKAYSYAKFLPETLGKLGPEYLEDHLFRFAQIVEKMDIRFDRLWKRFGFSDPFLHDYFQQEFQKLGLRPEERSLYVHLIQSLNPNNMDHCTAVIHSRPFRSMRGHFLQLLALFFDFYLCGTILESPPGMNNILFVGSNHFKNLKRFFHRYEVLDQCQSDEVTSYEKFKCLPLQQIQKHLH